MQESDYMDTYDATKNNAGLAANVSCLNLNVDMLRRADPSWNGEKALPVVVGLLLKWLRGEV